MARTQSYPSAASLAYAPVIDWMRSQALRPSLPRLDEVWLVELSRLMPELRSAYAALPPPAPLTAVWQRQNLMDALCQAIQARSRPLLLLLDDLQWVDQDTLDWLAHFLTRYSRVPVLVLATLRSEELEPEHSLHVWRSSLQAHRLLSEVPLQPLDWAETAALGAAVAGRPLAPALAHDLYVETEGNPLFIVETVHAHRFDSDNLTAWVAENDADTARLPKAILGAIRTRLTNLSPQARQVLAIAAVAGIQFAGDVLALAGQLDEEIFVRALDELWRRRIIRELEVEHLWFHPRQTAQCCLCRTFSGAAAGAAPAHGGRPVCRSRIQQGSRQRSACPSL